MIRLHHVPGSRSFRVLWLLHEMGLPCEVVPLPAGRWILARSGISAPVARRSGARAGD